MSAARIWHRLSLHDIVTTGLCDMFGTVHSYCKTCQERGLEYVWYRTPNGFWTSGSDQ